MQEQEITFSVIGMKPVAWGNNEWEWRSAIAKKIREISTVKNWQKLDYSHERQFSVKIIFSMTAAHIKRTDLDNLAKPILDTLFLSRNPQAPRENVTGVLFPVDDSLVYKLILEKRVVDSETEEGAKITVN